MKERIGQTMIDYLIEGVDYQSSVSTQQILLGTSFDLLCLVIIACSPKLFSVGLLFAFLETHYILFSGPNQSQTAEKLACLLEVATIAVALCLANYDYRVLLFVILVLCTASDLVGFFVTRYTGITLYGLAARIFLPAAMVTLGYATSLLSSNDLILTNVGFLAIIGQYCTCSFEKNLGISRSNYRRVHATSDIYTNFLRRIDPDKCLGVGLHGSAGYLDRFCGFITASSIILLVKLLLH